MNTDFYDFGERERNDKYVGGIKCFPYPLLLAHTPVILWAGGPVELFLCDGSLQLRVVVVVRSVIGWGA